MRHSSFLVCAVCIAVLVCVVASASADVFTVTFDEFNTSISNISPPYAEAIGSYYSGGFGSNGTGPGPNYGLTFDSGAYAAGDLAATGYYPFANEPSPPNVAGDLGSAMTIDSSPGIQNGLYLYYDSPLGPADASVYDGPGGTGTLLADVPLAQSSGGDVFDTWTGVSIPFSGTAYSVVLSGPHGETAWDSITFGSPDAPQVPEPGTLGLLAMGLVGLALKRKRKV